MKNYEIDDKNYILSSIGNAYFSGLSFDELWNCISHSNNPKKLDVAVSIQIELNKLISK